LGRKDLSYWLHYLTVAGATSVIFSYAAQPQYRHWSAWTIYAWPCFTVMWAFIARTFQTLFRIEQETVRIKDRVLRERDTDG
jgi:hypothetical protein